MKLKLYTIRLCRAAEYEKLVEFFRRYWSENHVFCRNKEIFEFQHGTAEKGEYDFIIAQHNETQEIHAVLGYISSATYDWGDVLKPRFISGALWKVRDDVTNSEIGKLGLGVLYFLLKKFPASPYITLGLSRFSQQIYEALHFDFGLLIHYYIAANYSDKFYIADKPKVNHNATRNKDYTLEYISAVPIDFDTYYYPRKTVTYIANRYINHPFYDYKLLGIYHKKQLQVIWIIRKVNAVGHKCLRLVDIVGNMDKVQNIEGNIHELLATQGTEFIDCYNHGISREVFRQIGFSEVDGETVIPNYFEPFERKNVAIHYAAYAKEKVVIFKGDCDQDRPNLLSI